MEKLIEMLMCGAIITIFIAMISLIAGLFYTVSHPNDIEINNCKTVSNNDVERVLICKKEK